MANSESVGGVDQYTLYQIESVFGTKPSGTWKQFGINVNFSNGIRRNLQQKKGNAGASANARKNALILPGKVDASLSLDFDPVDWNWLELVFGTVAGSGTSASPFVYTIAKHLPSFSILDNTDNAGSSSTDLMEGFLGNKIESCTIKTSFGESVTLSLGVVASGKTIASTTLETNVSLGTIVGWNFSSSVVKVDSAEVANIVESVELSIGNTPTVHGGINSSYARQITEGGLDVSVKLTFKYLDNTWVNKLFGEVIGVGDTLISEAMTKIDELTFELTGTESNKAVVFTLTDLYIDEIESGKTVNEVINEGLTLIPTSIQASEQISA